MMEGLTMHDDVLSKMGKEIVRRGCGEAGLMREVITLSMLKE